MTPGETLLHAMGDAAMEQRHAATLREQAAAYRDQAAHWRACEKYADSYQAGDYDLGWARELEQLAAALCEDPD